MPLTAERSTKLFNNFPPKKRSLYLKIIIISLLVFLTPLFIIALSNGDLFLIIISGISIFICANGLCRINRVKIES